MCESRVPQLIFDEEGLGFRVERDFHLRVHAKVHLPLAGTVTYRHHVHASRADRHKDIRGGQSLWLQEVQGCERLGKFLRRSTGVSPPRGSGSLPTIQKK